VTAHICHPSASGAWRHLARFFGERGEAVGGEMRQEGDEAEEFFAQI